MSDHSRHLQVPVGSERSFGIVFSVVFLIVAAWPLLSGGSLRLWAMGIAIALLLLAFLRPKVLTPPNRLWFRFGMIAGAVIAPVVIALVYVLTVVPTGAFLRLTRRDVLRVKIDASAETYWIERKQPISSMKNQY